MPRLTQLDIASHVGVSRSTVAAVLSRSPQARISPQVRQRILSTAAALNYRPNNQAQLLRGAKSGCIGVLSFNGMFALSQRKVKAAADAILAQGYQLVVQEVLWYGSQDEQAIKRAVEGFLDARVEGILLVYPSTAFTQEWLNKILEAEVAVVGIAGDHLHGIANFVSDRTWGYEQITRHLLEEGFRRLALLSNDSSYEKIGFFKALENFPEAREQARILHPVTPANCLKELSIEDQYYMPGVWGMRQILESEKELPEALVCANDHWALGALQVCHQADIRVPEDMAITGFDNDPAGKYGAIPLTTMNHPVRRISQQAVARLVEIIQNNQVSLEDKVSIRGELIVRKSSGLTQVPTCTRTTWSPPHPPSSNFHSQTPAVSLNNPLKHTCLKHKSLNI